MSAKTDIAALIKNQMRAHHSALPVHAKTRQKRLQRVINILVDHKDALAAAMDADFGGRDPTYSTMNDLLGSIMSLDHARKKTPNWMRSSPRAAIVPFRWFGATGRVDYLPKGVVGIIGAWNAPLFTLFAPLGSALAAGNRAILKPSELVPETAQVLKSAFDAHFDPDIIAVITGGPEVGAALSTSPLGQIVFTGGAKTGRKVMAAAAKNLTPVILELGGKSPVIVGHSADVNKTAQSIALAKGQNSGQICVTPDTVYVPKGSEDALVSALQQSYQDHFGSDAMTTSIINDQHLARFSKLLQTAKSVPDNKSANLAGRRKLPLSIVVDPPASAPIVRAEIFGPALLVKTYSLLDAVIADIRSRPAPLALYYFGKDKAEETYVFDQLLSGGAATNDLMTHAALNDAPFGGVGGSGMGSYHGFEGFINFSHARTHYRAGWWDPRQAFGMTPPYSDKLKKMVDRTVEKYRCDP